jgi:hypothetical protein
MVPIPADRAIAKHPQHLNAVWISHRISDTTRPMSRASEETSHGASGAADRKIASLRRRLRFGKQNGCQPGSGAPEAAGS